VPVIRPFALVDILLVYQLQRGDTPLAIEHVLTHPRPPLWLALTAPWPWAGVGVATYVLRSHGQAGAGFVQLLKRSARPEADLVHIAPALPHETDSGASALPVWRQLLAYCCEDAARSGIERVYASIPDGGPEQSCLGEANFRLFTRETIYRLASVPRVSKSMAAGYRQQSPQDTWSLQRCYTQTTPLLVQQAEGALSGRAGSPPLSWWEPERWRGVVWAPAGEVRGAVRVHTGRAGHWLHILGANTLSAREIRGLVEQGLRLLRSDPRTWHRASIPVYATVRDYDTGLSGALTGFGFAPFTDRARYVRHTLGTATKRLPVVLPLREPANEVVVH
jgi:hypothetical protein